ncbi:uncharacterized protein LOC116349212 [Contarinia nasturtii]|uniref:uncharacterized protein LOC116349212 n=1 Tax=Contarinia nasturtii TaxID=265458 RepID=UPI0012D4494D|nr:uncharacterized protein LOC116349212 [Contarinia nasturtii]
MKFVVLLCVFIATWVSTTMAGFEISCFCRKHDDDPMVTPGVAFLYGIEKPKVLIPILDAENSQMEYPWMSFLTECSDVPSDAVQSQIRNGPLVRGIQHNLSPYPDLKAIIVEINKMNKAFGKVVKKYKSFAKDKDFIYGMKNRLKENFNDASFRNDYDKKEIIRLICRDLHSMLITMNALKK